MKLFTISRYSINNQQKISYSLRKQIYTLSLRKFQLLILFLKNIMQTKQKIYSIQVTGIKCTNCAGKIKTCLDNHLKGQKSKVSINILQEIVTLSTQSEKDLIPSILEKLKQLGYPAIKDPILLEGGQQSHRYVTIKVEQNNKTEKLQVQFKSELMGIVALERTHEHDYLKFKLTYDSDIIKGKQIAEFLEKYDPKYQVINQRVQSFKSGPKQKSKGMPLYRTIILCLFFLIFNMILPLTGQWYDQMSTFPQSFSIFSLSVILNTILAFYVFMNYSRHIIYRAIHNYIEFRATDMETLISLGSMSAIALWVLFLVKYGRDLVNNDLDDPAMAVMDINDALTSASIIVLVVNIGKYFEQKIKSKIDKMSEQIFPESTLFTNMIVQLIELQNRKLKIKGRKNMDFTLLEKGDIVSLNSLINSRLLVDVIIISGNIRAMQSTTTGCEDIVQLSKGDRVQSGGVLYSTQVNESPAECLGLVENVFEKSMLVQIGTQVKFSQNQEDNNAEGIQAVCKSIANIFVKSVIIFSILTMIIWTVLIKFDMVALEEKCSICWIVERGIGVLVASCPCALGLAVPSVIAIVLNLATKSGILIKNNGVFQKMKITKKISFDKTGTLFTRINKIEEYHIFSTDLQESQLWEIIALIEKQIRHPLAQVLYKQAFKKSEIEGTNYNFIIVQKPKVQKEGIICTIRNKLNNQTLQVLIGNQGILTKNNIQVPVYDKTTDAGTELFLALSGQAQLVLLLNTHSNLRPEAVDVIRKIMNQGQQVHILSGDSKDSVIKLAQFLQIPDYNLHPQHSSFMKMEWIKSVQKDNNDGVMMIGDGLNDIPCLQQSAIGVSINAKSQLNINAADVVVLEENLYKILALIRLLKKGNLFININLFWAFSYNIIIMPIVAGAFYKWDIWVSPATSSIAMSLSSIMVVSISHLLSFFTFDDSLVKKDPKKRSMGQKIFQNTIQDSSIGVVQKTKKKKRQGMYLQLIESN